jgi:hypothetical protein
MCSVEPLSDPVPQVRPADKPSQQLVLLLARSDRSKELEILLLRHELSIVRRQARRPQLTESDRLVLAMLSRLMRRRSWRNFSIVSGSPSC